MFSYFKKLIPGQKTKQDIQQDIQLEIVRLQQEGKRLKEQVEDVNDLIQEEKDKNLKSEIEKGEELKEKIKQFDFRNKTKNPPIEKVIQQPLTLQQLLEEEKELKNKINNPDHPKGTSHLSFQIQENYQPEKLQEINKKTSYEYNVNDDNTNIFDGLNINDDYKESEPRPKSTFFRTSSSSSSEEGSPKVKVSYVKNYDPKEIRQKIEELEKNLASLCDEHSEKTKELISLNNLIKENKIKWEKFNNDIKAQSNCIEFIVKNKPQHMREIQGHQDIINMRKYQQEDLMNEQTGINQIEEMQKELIPLKLKIQKLKKRIQKNKNLLPKELSQESELSSTPPSYSSSYQGKN